MLKYNWLNKCASCSDGRGFRRRYKLGEDGNKPITWYVWKQTESEQLTKVVEDSTATDLFEHVKTLLLQFLEHCFVKTAEVQSMHWSKKEVSLLTAAICFHAKFHPTVLLSDNLDHSKETIIPCMDIIFQMLPDSV